MTYDARQIANWFIQRAGLDGKVLSIMSLLKLVYISHGWHLEMHDQPLISNRVEAWRYGPVIPDVYHAFESQGLQVRSIVGGFSCELDERSTVLLEQVYGIYGSMTSSQLSNLTHVFGGPWQIASRIGGSYAEIPDELIKLHYQAKRRDAEKAS